MATGAGLILILEVRLIRYLRDQLESISPVERWLGRLTFLWRDLDQKMILALGEIPDEHLDHTVTTGKWLAAVGFFGVTVLLTLFLRWRWSRS